MAAAAAPAAATLLRGGASAVVATGGHGPERGDQVRDLVLQPGAEPVWIERKREPGEGIRGSGCRFATALACGLARGNDLQGSARAAGEFVAQRIREASAPEGR